MPVLQFPETCFVRMHIECMSKFEHAARHFHRRVNVNKGEGLLLQAWEGEITAQVCVYMLNFFYMHTEVKKCCGSIPMLQCCFSYVYPPTTEKPSVDALLCTNLRLMDKLI